MKSFFYSTLALTLSVLLSATGLTQGIYQLWGTTAQGGSDDLGVVFRADGEGNNVQPVHSFTRTNLGATPMYNQLTEYNGKFYSMTSAGGSNDLGVIFEWDPVSNIYTKKYDFEIANGINPHGSLVVLNGKLYGMTVLGGANGRGVIFEWDPVSNIYTKKYDFDGTTGSNPYGSLLLNGGKFYGMTHSGGSNDLGVIFEWDPLTNFYTKKHDFDGITGSNPYGDLVVKDGNFYGMTYSGGSNNYGVIFEWESATNNYTVKITFLGSGINVGANPYSSLVLANGKFYGMTFRGGSIDFGDIFEWDPVTNIYTKKFDFGGGSSSSNTDGADPYGNLVFKDGKFYGMASRQGGGRWSRGLLFEWDPVTNIYNKKYVYELSPDEDETYNGANPRGSLVISGGKIYGMTSYGGSSEGGVIFEWDPAGSGIYTKKINFNHPHNGESPNSLVFNGNKLYGITSLGGTDGLGVIFQWDFASNTFIKKHDLHPASGNGRKPTGNLVFCNGKFYGMTFYVTAPVYFHQHIFEWDPVTNVFTPKASFSVGVEPTGNLAESGGKLYGMFNRGGPAGGGIFKWDPVTNLFTKLHEFDNGSPRSGSGLIERAGKLYGVIPGGANGAGFIFEWDIAGNSYTKKYDLVAATGSSPVGNLLLYNDKFYGMTDAGGSNNKGVIFEWDPVSNSYTKEYDFNVTDGGNPVSTLVVNNGKLYGMTKNGGSSDVGVIFEWDPVTNTYSKKSDFTGANGRNPVSRNALTLVPASVTGGLPGNCVSYSPVTIDNTNNNAWVPIMDDNGLAVAEIKANGNNLGIVNASVYINNSTVREDNAGRLYLDRNITITPQFQPSSPVDIRLYIRGSEFTTIKNANNSVGSPSGISTINDLGVFKNDDNCGGTLADKATPVTTTAATWANDYVLSTSVTSFSTFYFASKANAALPLTLLEFSGRLQNNNALLNWKTENELNTVEFIVERSIDGIQYKAVGTVTAANRPGIHNYNFTDPSVTTSGAKIIYYRLQQKDLDGHFTYSKIVTLSLDNENTLVRLYPNPVSNELNLVINSTQRDNIKWQIIDVSGRIINNQIRQVTTGGNNFAIDVTRMAKGVYFLSIQGNEINKWLQFVKQ